MTWFTSSKEIAIGYVAAGATLCGGMYLGLKVGTEGPGGAVIMGGYIFALLLVLRSTFAWGRLRGFCSTKEDGSVAIPNIFRNLLMSAIVWIMILLVSGPFAMLSNHFAR